MAAVLRLAATGEVIAGDASPTTAISQAKTVRAVSAGSGSVSSDFDRKQVQVQRLITAYRIRAITVGTDPLGLMQRHTT